MKILGYSFFFFAQTIHFPGAGGFSQVDVVAFDVTGGGGGGGQEVLGVWVKAVVWNPSDLSATLGAVTFDLVFDGGILGQVRERERKREIVCECACV